MIIMKILCNKNKKVLNMKVLSLVTNRYANFYVNQIKTLKELGIDIHNIYPSKQSSDRDERVKTSRNFMDYYHLYLKILKKSVLDYDLVHANNGLMAPFALAQPKRPIVVTLWGSDIMSGGYSQKVCNISVSYFNDVILPSERMAPYLSSEYNYIPFGVDTNLFYPISQEEAREILGWEQDNLLVLFADNPDRKVKNYNLASKVVNNLSCDADLKVVSGVPNKKMPYYYNASDAVLITSKRESGPMVVKEAALCNIPVVSTDVGFVSDVLDGISNSFVCNSKRELVERLEYVLTERKRSNGRKKLEDEVSLEKMGKDIIRVYERAIKVTQN